MVHLILPAPLMGHLRRLAQQRAAQPVWRDPQTGLWHVYRYADVARVLTDTPSFGSTAAPGAAAPAATAGWPDAARQAVMGGKLREALAPHTVARLAAYVGQAAGALLDPLLPAGRIEMMGDLARPLAWAVFAELLGMPAADRAPLAARLAPPGAAPVPEGTPHGPLMPAAADVDAYLAQLVADRRPDPQGDLVSRLLAPGPGGEQLARAEVVVVCGLLLGAGPPVLADLLGNAVLCLSAPDPDEDDLLARLRHEPPPLYSATEEVLRFLPPIWSVPRVVRAAVTLGGEPVPAGARVVAWIAAANRDPQQFAEPDRFDLDRIPNRHLTFADGGAWACLSAGLARLVIRQTLAILAQRLQRIAPAAAPTPEVVGLPTRCRPVWLPMRFAPRG